MAVWPAGRPAQATLTTSTGVVNGSFESAIGRPWDRIFFSPVSGSTWERVGFTHPGKVGDYYLSTCDGTYPSDRGCSHGTSETHTGTMRSNRFRLTANTVKFRLAGWNGSGCTGDQNQARLRRAANDGALAFSKPCGNALADVSWPVTPNNQWVYVELVDAHSASGYAWIAVDNVRVEEAGGGIPNGGFEQGMANWTPIDPPWGLNDTWPLYNGQQQAGREGSNCAGSYTAEYGQGSLASSTFWVNRPYLNFRIGGWHQYGGQSGANTVHLESVTGG
ncbi:MAG: hypothetical protein AB1505_20395, partial [Candidatus Latescibacterota bacterium]